MEQDAAQPHSLRWIWLIRDTRFSSPGMQHLAFLVAARAGANNEASPGLVGLAACIPSERGGTISAKTASNWLKALTEAGFLSTRRETKGRGHTNVYTLTFPKRHGEVDVVVGNKTYRFDIPDPAQKPELGPLRKPELTPRENRNSSTDKERLEERQFYADPQGSENSGNGLPEVARSQEERQAVPILPHREDPPRTANGEPPLAGYDLELLIDDIGRGRAIVRDGVLLSRTLGTDDWNTVAALDELELDVRRRVEDALAAAPRA
jgi:hypothetical protein